MLHEITIEASPQAVFDAITTEKGLRSWWTDDVTAEPKQGSVAQFSFNNKRVTFKMQIDELAAPTKLRWSCQGDPQEWKGTKLTFDLEERDEGLTRLRFGHREWASTEGAFALCNTTWGHLIVLLKMYCEGDEPGAYFRADPGDAA